MFPPGNGRTRLLAIPAAGLALMVFAVSVQAASKEQSLIAVHHVDRNLGSDAKAKVLLDRLSEAAMEACGGSSSNMPQHRRAVRDSACWRTSMTAVVQRIDNPYLTAAFAGRGAQQALATRGETVADRS